MKLRHHVRRMSSESAALPPNLPPRVSIWLLAALAAGAGPLAAAVALGFTGLFRSGNNLPNLALNWMTLLSILSVVCVQGIAVGGLAMRRDWGRGMAVLTCLLWACWLVGIVPAVVIVFLLSRWKYNDTAREADAPHWLRWLYGVGAIGGYAGWIAFAAWARSWVMSTTPTHLDIFPILLIANCVLLPLFVLQAAALYGLVTRRHWGREAATAASIVWAFTFFGLPFAYLSLKALWPSAVPVRAAAPA